MHKVDLVIDFQFGSTGKGLLAGYLAKRGDYDTVVCSFATNAGHRYVDGSRNLEVMTQQLPTGITSSTVKNVLIGPGALVHLETLKAEMERYAPYLAGKRLFIHPAAAIVRDSHARAEANGGMSKIGSTTKGVGEAMIQRIRRNPDDLNVAGAEPYLSQLAAMGFTVGAASYRDAIESAESVLVEGAQGFSLSMYHGMYPYTTSRDVTPWQIAADCGLPFKCAPYIQVCGTLRTFPIRVNNRDGTSGPGYGDQLELDWATFNGIAPELTTVTKLPRRIFTFSQQQLTEAAWHCGGYYHTKLFLNFANYTSSDRELLDLIAAIETPRPGMLNVPKVEWLGFGPDDCDVMTRAGYDDHIKFHNECEGGTPE
jgi:adenylosuccinate synthase